MHESNLSVRNVTYAFVTYYIEKKKVKKKKIFIELLYQTATTTNGKWMELPTKTAFEIRIRNFTQNHL